MAPRAYELVTPAKRRRILAEQRMAQREDAAAARAANDAAWLLVARSLPYEVQADANDVVPFFVHGSHECLACGGFVGCIRCGSVVSAQQRSALSHQCRGSCPDGASGPVRRLAAGLLPRGKAWPSGETAPLPKRRRR